MTTVSPPTDVLGYPCTPAAALDDPATWGKGLRPPQTCFETVPPRLPEVLAEALGREPTEPEWQTFSYRICAAGDSCAFGAPEVSTLPAVPLPAGGVLLASALLLVAVWRAWR